MPILLTLEVARYISKLDIDSRVTIAVYHGPESQVVSGEMKELRISTVKADALRAKNLAVDQGEFYTLIARIPSDPRFRLSQSFYCVSSSCSESMVERTVPSIIDALEKLLNMNI